MLDWEKTGDYLILPRLKKVVRVMARLGIITLWAALICNIISFGLSSVILLFESYQGGDPPVSYILYVVGSHAALLFSLGTCVCLGLLLPWCHCVLLHHQGWVYTRALSGLGLLLSLLMLVTYPLHMMLDFKLLANQELAPFLILTLLALSLLCNWSNMAALAISRRASLMLAPLLLLLVLVAPTFYSALIQLALLLVLIKPLRWLNQHAELIIAMPPLEDN